VGASAEVNNRLVERALEAFIWGPRNRRLTAPLMTIGATEC